MYICIKKNSPQSGVFKDLSQLSRFINKDVRTISKKLKVGRWETDDFIVDFASKVQIKSLRGDKNGANLKKCNF
jgi:hypothetical protein